MKHGETSLIGFRRISMSPAAIGPVKLMVRSLDVGKLERFMEGLMKLPDGSVRPQLKAFAEAEGISV